MSKTKLSLNGISRNLTNCEKFLGRFTFSTGLFFFLKSIVFVAIIYALYYAYAIRVLNAKMYGELIHEFDPWFNYRAAEYLSTHGWSSFFQWFDYMSWYPLGRPVGSTIYPGMQITAVAIHRVLNAVGIHMSINAVCVYIPAWFGVVATLLNALITYEISGSLLAVAVAAYTFSMVPAHTMRSMAGEFDNECIAVAAMLLCFYLWIRSLRNARSWPVGLVTGLAYGYMVAAWGGHVFTLNMIALHAGLSALLDWALNRYNPSLLYSYSLFFIVGTTIATRVPPVGMSPFKSLEQLSALLVFVFLWTLHMSEALRKRADVNNIRSRKCLRIRIRALSMTAFGLVLAAALLLPLGYFQSFSHRVRALFLKHTYTGNPLVDSVAEHQATSRETFQSFLRICETGWILGFALLLLNCVMRETPAKTFVLIYSVAAYYFSQRMSRLLILAGPVASTLTGFIFGLTAEYVFSTLWWNVATGDPEAEVGSVLDKRKTLFKTNTKKKEITHNDKKKTVMAVSLPQ
ncbi:unnamed protein product [Phytomonas sp. Hart1]|nr:unnamed protein product [Phytomonas sp. Hart1]|eukprot:CCW71932.1 unnamed protein product [Phytomonas sp. isolate Hart1]